MTAHGSVATAVEAMRGGASDFLVKPFAAGAPGRHAGQRAGTRAACGATVATLAAGAPRVGPGGLHRRRAGDAGGLPHHRERGARRAPRSSSPARAAPARNWRPRRCTALSPRAAGPFVAAQLRRHPEGPDRERDLRPCARRLHRRDRRPPRCRARGRWRHAVPRRDLRDGPRAAGQAAALHPDRHLRAGGRDAGRCAPMCASSAPPTATRWPRCRPGASARTCTTACTWCRCALPPLRERGEDVMLLAEAFLARSAAEEGKRFSRLRPGRGGAAARASLAGQCARAGERDPHRRGAARRRGGGGGDAAGHACTARGQPAAAAAAPPARPTPRGASARWPRSSARRSRTPIAPVRRQRAQGGRASSGVSPSTLYRKREAWAQRG